MLTNEDLQPYINVRVCGADRQAYITIPRTEWRHFETGQRVTLISKKGVKVPRKIIEIADGRQRIVTISQHDRDMFEVGDMIDVYPPQKDKLNEE